MLLEGSSGSFAHISISNQSPNTPEMRVHLDPCVYCRGSKPWRFDNCDVRSAGSIAVTARPPPRRRIRGDGCRVMGVEPPEEHKSWWCVACACVRACAW